MTEYLPVPPSQVVERQRKVAWNVNSQSVRNAAVKVPICIKLLWELPALSFAFVENAQRGEHPSLPLLHMHGKATGSKLSSNYHPWVQNRAGIADNRDDKSHTT